MHRGGVLRRAAMAAVALGLAAGCTSTASEVGGTSGSAAEQHAAARIRVDQAGYVLNEPKIAHIMGTEADLRGATFRVLDADGDEVRSGPVGPKTGTWNERYPAVHEIDLTDLDEPGTYTVDLDDDRAVASPPFDVGTADALIAPLRADNVRFFQAQRDGADVTGDVLDRKPSHLLDAEATVYAVPRSDDDGQLLDQQLEPVGGPVDVTGGWFDAGDFLKFTGTTAYATSALLLADRWAPGTPGLADEAYVGLAWLDRMWDGDSGVLSAQVGIGEGTDDLRTDHDVWRLPEDDDANAAPEGDPDHLISHRPVFPANRPGQPISPNLAGRVAAAFALAAQATADDDSQAAQQWLAKAAAVYAAADPQPDELLSAVPNAFYPEDSYADDLELAATELAIAGTALDDGRADAWQADAERWAGEYLASDSQGTLGLGDVSALAHADLLSLDPESADDLEADLQRQLDAGVKVADADPFGVGASTTEFDSVPNAFGLAATAHLYERATGDDRYRSFADHQQSWVFGDNPWGSSFVIGAGTTYPQCPEHQVANLTGQELIGAVVNGPNRAELLTDLNGFEDMVPCSADDAGGHPYSDYDGNGARYLDEVGAWQTVEPALDFTATAALALALEAAPA